MQWRDQVVCWVSFISVQREKHTALQSRIAPSEVVSCENTLPYRARLYQCSGSGDVEKGFRAPVGEEPPN